MVVVDVALVVVVVVVGSLRLYGYSLHHLRLQPPSPTVRRLQVDHTAVTVNIALSDGFDGGGTFVRASSKAAPTEAGRSSQASN